MISPAFSEFSYGFALLSELVERYRDELWTPPVLPSLRDEGRDDGGWDARLDVGDVIVLLQFKLAERMVRSNAAEWFHFRSPYYRFPIRSRRYSNQHQALITHERGGNLVYYVAPGFHLPHEFHNAFFGRLVERESVFVSPLAIGDITDDDEHVVGFRPNDRQVVAFSEPRPVDRAAGGPASGRQLISAARRRATHRGPASLDQFLASVSTVIAELAQDTRGQVVERLADWPPLRRAAFLARTVLEGELIIVRPGPVAR